MCLITSNEKSKIANALSVYADRYPSRNAAAKSLTGCSPATLSAILNCKWENISDNMWKILMTQVSLNKEWKNVEISSFRQITYALNDARDNANCIWITGAAGCGKTTTAKIFTGEHKNVFYVACDADMQKSDFIHELARACGIQSQGMKMRVLISDIVTKISVCDDVLIIFDEADKLMDSIFYYFIDLYNKLEDLCGIAFLSTDYIKRRIQYGLQFNKKGYNEIYSRIGRKFFELEPTTNNDVIAICTANGITDKKMVNMAVKDAESCDNDLRRVKRAIHRVKRISKEQANHAGDDGE